MYFDGDGIMKFYILSKKNNFNENNIDETFLNSLKAPSLIAHDMIKKEFENITCYLYTYDDVIDEMNNISYNDDEISFINGSISFDNLKINEIDEIFEKMDDTLVLGDFQAIRLNSEGNGIFKSSQVSIYPLFYYEDDYCSILSNELKLIVDSLNCFRNSKFVNFYDGDYIFDMVKSYNNKKETPRNTIFKNIRRVLPYDDVSIKEGAFSITENSTIDIPSWFEDWYFEDKDSLYDWYFEQLMNYTNNLFYKIKDDVNEIWLGLSGGFDSRLTISVLEKLCPQYGIKLRTLTYGTDDNHPDVVIASRVADLLNVDWRFKNDAVNESELRYLPKSFNEFANTFYQSQGDFDSYDYITKYSREISKNDSFYQMGMNVYKRDDIYKINRFNRWLSRRTLFSSNFYFPLFSTDLESWFALLFNKHFPDQAQYKEFIYEVLRRVNPDLLQIPFAFESLPQVNLEEFTVEGYISTRHQHEDFLWDYNFVLSELDPALKDKFMEINEKYDDALSKTGITPLDYLILQKDINRYLDNYSGLDLHKKLLELNNNHFYPKYRDYLSLNDTDENFKKNLSLLVIMDYASAASFNSFYGLEKSCEFYENEDCNPVLDYKQEIYADISNIRYNEDPIKSLMEYHMELRESNKYLTSKTKKLKIVRGRVEESRKVIKETKNELDATKKELEKTKKENEEILNATREELDKARKENEEILNSNSWKVTKPLRGITQLKQKPKK